MAVTTWTAAASADDVWKVLADGWLFPLWVVGACRIRGVDDTWPEPGSRLHHSVGVWPVVIDDHTESLACDPGKRLELQARAWPLGEARVVLTLRPSGEDTEIEIEEDLTHGPGGLLPRPLRAGALHVRNLETLKRLAMLAEGRA
ncbi:SRPBCC family protein [Nocardioides sp. CER19]|uniref:SRPBCC family protein n=1 Tax=Nocardioides sp. CER19 TaxID=3038538 RepID=UPI0024486C19|nr:SRPBCC family protein [Nocardioides sp. CER19]MDH2413146.1 SRPBCC family protein [Nocardioides sp. CER19]